MCPYVNIEFFLWILVTLKAAKSEAQDQQFIYKIVKKISKAKKTHDKHYKSMEWLNPKMKENFIRLKEAPYISNDKTNEQIIEFKKRQIAIENIFSDLSGATNKLFLNSHTLEFFLRKRVKGQLNSEWIYEVIVSPKM